jgi:hypothetical protein
LTLAAFGVSFFREVTVMSKAGSLKLYPEQIAKAILLLTAPEKRELVDLVPEIGRFARFRAMDALRERNATIPYREVHSDVEKAVERVRAQNG